MQKNSTVYDHLYTIMRITVLQGIVAMIFSGMAIAHENNAQAILDKEVSLQVKEVSLSEALIKITSVTKIKFVYSPATSAFEEKVSMDVTNKKLGEVLDELLKPYAISFKVDEKEDFIILKEEKKITQTDPDETASLIPVTGTIKDKNGTPMPGVSIVVKGTTRGTVTDSEGRYAIDVSDNETLLFSFIGYKAVEETLNGRSVVDLTMEEDVTTLNEVQILSTNYFSSTKEKSTMNISKVDGKEIQDQPVTGLMSAMIGRVPGLDITPRSGLPGNASVIQIRGNNSLTGGGSQPLYVIDGVQIESRPLPGPLNSAISGFDPLAGISPSDIESIEVLKDAAATAIYGSRGANGVIRVTTKRANQNKGKTNLDFSIYSGVGNLPNQVELLNREEYLEMRHEAFKNSGTNPGALDHDLNGNWDTTRTTNWQKVLLGGTANITDVQGNLNGGSDLNSFKIGGNYHKETTIYPGDNSYQRASGNVSFRHFSRDRKLEISAGVNYGYAKRESYATAQFVTLALTLPPVAPKLYNEDGTLNWQLYGPLSPKQNSWTNPLASLLNKSDNVMNSIFSSATISYELITGLKIETLVSLTNIYNDESQENRIESVSPRAQVTATGSQYFVNNNRKSFMLEPKLRYERSFNDHHFNSVAGITYQQSRSVYKSVEGQGYPSDALLGSVQGATRIVYLADLNSQYKYASTYVHIGYDYKGKYLIDLTGRRDGSSRFGPGKRYGNFGAVGIGWVFSEEGFVKNNLSFLSFGKIRSSYGVTGNDQIGDYGYLDAYAISGIGYQGGVSLIPTTLSNSDYAWEQTNKLEFAVELGILKNRVTVDGSWYRNVSSNQLVDYSLAATTGFESVRANFDATIENTGWEFLVSTQNILKENFSWRSSFNLTIPKNKLLKFDDIESSPYALQYKVGEPLSIGRYYSYQGIDPETGEYKFKDVDGNGVYNDSDKIFMEPLGRTAYYGLTNTLRYKTVELSFLLQFSNNPQANYLTSNQPGFRGYNQPVEVLDRWREQGDDSKYKRYTSFGDTNYQNVIQSNFNVTDASFIRLKTLSISYSFSNKLIERAKLQGVRLYLQGQNLLTFTNFNGLDPETGNSLPSLRMVTIGLQLKL